MSAARCSLCNANFPLDLRESTCPICDEEVLAGIENATEDDPTDLHRRISFAMFEREYGPAEVEV